MLSRLSLSCLAFTLVLGSAAAVSAQEVVPFKAHVADAVLDERLDPAPLSAFGNHALIANNPFP